jgi:multidrug efflux pump subunit AcrA (membrane-fusion protein)
VANGEALADIYATDYAEVRLPIANEQLALLDLPLAYRDVPDKDHGPAVRLSARLGERMYEWSARIVRTEGMLDPESGMLHAVARIDDPYRYRADRPPLLAGLFVQAEIEGRKRSDVFRLPAGALYRGAPRVMVVDGEQRLQFRDVTVLRRERDAVYLTRGLTPGERVIVGGLDVPVEGMRVRYQQDVAPAGMSAQRP